MLLVSILLSQARETILGDSKWEWRSQLLCYLAELRQCTSPDGTALDHPPICQAEEVFWGQMRELQDSSRQQICESEPLNPWLHPSKPPRPHAAHKVSKVLSSAVKIIELLKQAELKIPPANDSYFPDLDAKVCSLPSCLHFCVLADSFYPST